VLGSPTINNSMIPSIGAFLMTLKGLKPRRKIGATFGSYGWGGEAVRHMNDWFDDMKISRINDGLRIKYIPDEAQIEECVRFGEEIATATMALGKDA
jgi:flavorubredoxin